MRLDCILGPCRRDVTILIDKNEANIVGVCFLVISLKLMLYIIIRSQVLSMKLTVLKSFKRLLIAIPKYVAKGLLVAAQKSSLLMAK